MAPAVPDETGGEIRYSAGAVAGRSGFGEIARTNRVTEKVEGEIR
jgi:hypothetical protein